MTGLLDGEKTRRRRKSLGLSERKLGREVGVDGSAIHNLERDRNTGELAFAVIDRLLTVLGVTLDDLRPDDPVLPEGDDVAVVGALLAHEDTLTPVSVIAEVLDWDLARVEAALDELDTRLVVTGQRVHRLGLDVKVVSAVAPASLVQDLARRSLARRGVNICYARIVHQAMTSRLPRAPNNAEKVAIAAMVNAGILTDAAGDRGEVPVLSEDTRFSLMLDEPPPPMRPAAARPSAASSARSRSANANDAVASRATLPRRASRTE